MRIAQTSALQKVQFRKYSTKGGRTVMVATSLVMVENQWKTGGKKCVGGKDLQTAQPIVVTTGITIKPRSMSPVHLFWLCASGSTDLGLYLWGN